MDNRERLPPEYQSVLEIALEGKIDAARALSLVNNSVYLVEVRGQSLVAKFYTTRGMHYDNELLVYRVLPSEGRRFLRPLVYSDESLKNVPVRFAVFNYVPGRTVLELVEAGWSDLNAPALLAGLRGFLEACFAVETERFGYLRGDLRGSHESWPRFLHDYQGLTSYTLMSSELTHHLATLPYHILATIFDCLDCAISSMCPIDLNLSNLLVTEAGKLIVLDPGSVVAGTPRVSYGEFVAQVYGTRLYQPFLREMGLGREEERLVRAHAALSAMNVLGFIVRNRPTGIETSGPWGTPFRYLDLIPAHAAALGIGSPPVEARKCERMLDMREPQEPA